MNIDTYSIVAEFTSISDMQSLACICNDACVSLIGYCRRMGIFVRDGVIVTSRLGDDGIVVGHRIARCVNMIVTPSLSNPSIYVDTTRGMVFDDTGDRVGVWCVSTLTIYDNPLMGIIRSDWGNIYAADRFVKTNGYNTIIFHDLGWCVMTMPCAFSSDQPLEYVMVTREITM